MPGPHGLTRVFRGTLLAGLAALLAGCDGSGVTPVRGTVTIDGAPLAGATVTFVPDETTKGTLGYGFTGEDGRFEVSSAQGKSGLRAGTYRVTISKKLDPEGRPAPDPQADETFDDRSLREVLEPAYSDRKRTTLLVSVEPGKPADFDLASGKR